MGRERGGDGRGGGCGKRGEKIPTLLSINWRQGPVVVIQQGPVLATIRNQFSGREKNE